MQRKATRSKLVSHSPGGSSRRLVLHPLTVSILAAGLGGGAQIAFAQQAPERTAEGLVIEEVLVTARRKTESLQEVPLTVNAVTGERLAELNIRDMEDIETVVPGLSLDGDSLAPSASIRGVKFDTYASGFNSTVEFYYNDAPLVATGSFMSMFDVGQVEVLRGPQGTLRGRAAPSGSVTITSQRPDLEEFGGYIDLTATDLGGRNARAAVNVPLIENQLGVRLAGVYEENDGNRVENINTGDESEYKNKGLRFSLLYEPTDDLSINLSYQSLRPERVYYPQVESANREDPSYLVPPALGDIVPDDRKAVSTPDAADQEFDHFGAAVAWEIGRVQINYVGSDFDMLIDKVEPQDVGAAFYPMPWQRPVLSKADTLSHELRISPVELIADRFEYVVGAFYYKTTVDNGITLPGPVPVPIERPSSSRERSVFANLTTHFGDATELSLGVRRINYEGDSGTVFFGSQLGSNEVDEDATIYTASLKHQFSDDLMAYLSVGSAWRPGAEGAGNFKPDAIKSPRELSFENLEPEESDAVEVGFKSKWMDNRLMVNAAAYYQEFDNYPYRAGGPGVYYVGLDLQSQTLQVDQHNFVAAVPVNVYGFELETTYLINAQLSVGAQLSYSKGEIDDGTIPCSDYFDSNGNLGSDGQPDAPNQVPASTSDINTATGGENVAACQTDQRSNDAPLWAGTLSSEYRFNVVGLDSFLRGLYTFYGDSDNDPQNELDDVDAYGILNLYAGIRGQDSVWEAMLYGKNITDEEEVLERDQYPASAALAGVPSGYRAISLTPEREFGINLRYNF